MGMLRPAKLPMAKFDRDEGSMVLERYPFPNKRTRVLHRSDIEEIILWLPTTIRTTSNEFLMVSHQQDEACESFARHCGIPISRRMDLWSFLAEPYLDTEMPEGWDAKMRRWMNEAGLGDTEIDAIRETISGRMMALTMATWEWQHYGLYDVLMVMQPNFLRERAHWRRFYDRAMQIAAMGKEVEVAEI